MKSLYLVTFDIDLTQFLIETDDNLKAIKKAVEANLLLGDVDDDPSAIPDLENYSVENVDFDLLKEIIQRKDWLIPVKPGFNNVIIFTD